jgi:rhodanese-related sulfurtransferase
MIKRIAILVFVAVFSGTMGSLVGINIYKKYFEVKTNFTKDYYDTENTVAISPATLRKMIDEKDTSYILVDLRSKEEYNAEHIVGAINVPAVTIDEKEILSSFKSLPKDKQIIVYCYSAYCMLGRQIGQVLANNGINVKDLNVGWSEWKYYWGLWNPGEDPKMGIKYLEKGVGDTIVVPGVCTKGKFGC